VTPDTSFSLRDFDAILERSKIPAHLRPYYHRWLDYYLAFCSKNDLCSTESISLDPFLKDLKSRGRLEFQVTQAQHAVLLYRRLMEQQTAENPAREQQPPQSPSASSSGTPPTLSSSTLPLSPEPAEIHPDPRAAWDVVYAKVETQINLRHYSQHTLTNYLSALRQFAEFVDWKNPNDLDIDDAENFLSLMATARRSSGSTQNVAFYAIRFLFVYVLKKPYEGLDDVPRAKRKTPIPEVLSREEIAAFFKAIPPNWALPATLAYGCGLRLDEVMSLRILHFNLDTGLLTVQFGKGEKSRTVPLPAAAMPAIRRQMNYVGTLHRKDLDGECEGVILPSEVEHKQPNAKRELAWQWFFPATGTVYVKELKQLLRYHLHESNFQKAVKQAGLDAGISRPVTPHTLRHSCASHLLAAGYDIRQVQLFLGHADVRTTMIYLHTVKRETKMIRSPLDL